jgi:hypothetical protein
MAEGTTEFRIKASDGWVAVVTGGATHALISAAKRPFALAVGASPPVTSDTPASANISYTGQPADTNTLVIAGQTYTFKTALTPTAGEVLIGADQDASYANLAAAINGLGVPGTDYAAGTVSHPSGLSAEHLPASDDLTIRGTAAQNGVAVSETLANAAFDGAATSLAGGVVAIEGMVFGSRTWDDQMVAQLDGLTGNAYVRALQPTAQDEALRVTVIITG